MTTTRGLSYNPTMPSDITMCSGRGCPRRFDCFRHRAEPSGFRQDWFDQPPVHQSTGECDVYWSLDRLRPVEHEVRTRAYEIWERAGRPDGQALHHWLQAGEELEAEFQRRLRPVIENDEESPA